VDSRSVFRNRRAVVAKSRECADVLAGNVGLKFGDLTICNLSTLPALNGLGVRQYLDTVNALVGDLRHPGGDAFRDNPCRTAYSK